MEEGIFTKKVEKMVVEVLDNAIKLEGYQEIVSDYALKFGVPFIDNNIFDKLRDDIQEPLQQAGDLYYEGKFMEASEKMGDVVAILANVPGVDEEDEARISRRATLLITDVIQTALKKKAA